jgi:hypothetical protein
VAVEALASAQQVELYMADVTIAGCEQPTGVGGALKVLGENCMVRLVDCTISNCRTTASGGNGGGVSVSDSNGQVTLFMVRCNVLDCSASLRGGGLVLMASCEGCAGGGVAYLEDCVVAGNSAKAGGGATIMGNDGAASALTMVGGSISGNTAHATDGGGGVDIQEKATVSLTSVTIADNSVPMHPGTGGGLRITLGSDAENIPAVTLSTCIISGNRAVQGGAIYNDGGNLELSTRTVLLNNSAPDGATISFPAGSILYRLPAPAGRWLPSGECVIFRESCGVWGDCDQSNADCLACDADDSRAGCAVNSTAVIRTSNPSPCYPSTSAVGHCCTEVNFVQPCDWQADPSLLGQQIYTLLQDQPVGGDSSNHPPSSSPHHPSPRTHPRPARPASRVTVLCACRRQIDEDFPFGCSAGILGSNESAYQVSAACVSKCPGATAADRT